MKKVLIIEDNRNILELLANLAESVSCDVKVYAVDNVKDAYYKALEFEIDLFIVDVILDTSRPGDTSGLRFLDKIRAVERYRFVPVIIVASLLDPKLYCYEKLHCYGYIEKPFDSKQVQKLISQCLQFPEKKTTSKNLYFRKEGIIYSVNSSEIIFIEGLQHTIFIHTLKETLEIPYVTLKKLMDWLDGGDFVQCSRNVIINREYISYVDIVNRFISLNSGRERVEIGITYKKAIKKALRVLHLVIVFVLLSTA